MYSFEQTYYFPFGTPLQKVEQSDHSPKKVFILGLNASAVHAKWMDAKGKQKVSALAIANEPEPFWAGTDAEGVIGNIRLPEALGTLNVPINPAFNGQAGRALDSYFLKPMGLSRNDVWLCHMLPYSRMSREQHRALGRYYNDSICKKYGLSAATIPLFDPKEIRSKKRGEEILEELNNSEAQMLILLGDAPIHWLMSVTDGRKTTKLAAFGNEASSYGRLHDLKVDGRYYQVLPLCNPMQAYRPSHSDIPWFRLHESWMQWINTEEGRGEIAENVQ